MGQVTETITRDRAKQVTGAITRPANAVAYAAGDVITNADNTHPQFGNNSSDDGAHRLSRAGVKTGTVDSLVITSSANQSTKLDAELWLFSAEVADAADNSPFAPTDAELVSLAGIIDIPAADWKSGSAGAGAAGNAACAVSGIGLRYTAVKGVLYGVLVARNAYTPVASETFTVNLMVRED